jgi:hypothetical protein
MRTRVFKDFLYVSLLSSLVSQMLQRACHLIFTSDLVRLLSLITIDKTPGARQCIP